MQNKTVEKKEQTVAIIGGGVSGALTCAHLLNQRKIPLQIVLIEPRPEAGIGLAYCTKFDGHLLNVTAGGMSAFPDDPEHFVNYAKLHYPQATKKDFLPRMFFGEYIKHIYAEALDKSQDFHKIVRIDEKVADLESNKEGFKIELSNGQNVEAAMVMLALGNLSGRAPRWLDKLSFDDNNYIHNVWDVQRVASIQPTENLLIVGSGLTAIDQLVYLASRGHKGKITCVSKHGFFPQAHFQEPVIGTAQDSLPPANVLKALRELRTRAKSKDWRLVVDGVRSESQVWWQSLDQKEQRRFLRHVQTYWDIHRHRMAYSISEIVKELETKGQLQLIAGRVESMAKSNGAISVVVKARGSDTELRLEADRVLNCTGPQASVKTIDCPLLEKLYDRKLVISHPAGGGISCDSAGRVIGEKGAPRENLFAIGPMLKAQLFESVAVPEIKTQAKNTAGAIIERMLRCEANL